MITLRDRIRIDVRETRIGNSYHYNHIVVITVDDSSGNKGVFVSTTLGRHCVHFYTDTNGDSPVRTIEWYSDAPNASANQLKANLICRRELGASFDEAEEFWHSLPDDPMGHPSKYM